MGIGPIVYLVQGVVYHTEQMDDHIVRWHNRPPVMRP
jgi:hypothetical protein